VNKIRARKINFTQALHGHQVLGARVNPTFFLTTICSYLSLPILTMQNTELSSKINTPKKHPKNKIK
jgi:hypothetical protein